MLLFCVTRSLNCVVDNNASKEAFLPLYKSKYCRYTNQKNAKEEIVWISNLSIS